MSEILNNERTIFNRGNSIIKMGDVEIIIDRLVASSEINGTQERQIPDMSTLFDKMVKPDVPNFTSDESDINTGDFPPETLLSRETELKYMLAVALSIGYLAAGGNIEYKDSVTGEPSIYWFTDEERGKL